MSPAEVAPCLKKWLRTCVVWCLIPFSISHAQSNPGQAHISLHVKQVTLPDLLQEITHQTGVAFFYNLEELGHFPAITIHVTNETVSNVLAQVFKGTNLQYRFTENLIMIQPGSNNNSPADTTLVKGIVVDQNGFPLPKANIIAVTSGAGVTSGHDGSFQLRCQPSAQLQISYLGMKTVRTIAKSDTILHIILQPASTVINEVVVNGFSDIRQRYNAGAVTSIAFNSLTRKDMFTIDNMLQGAVPGLNINLNSTLPGATPKIRLRGTATLMGNREPIWVIDGVIADAPMKLDPADANALDNVNLMTSAVTGLNPYDIERIDILKDAAAANLYGVNGGNGVIVVTTRKGNYKHLLEVKLSQLTSIVMRPTYNNLNRMTAAQKISISKEAIDNKIPFGNTVFPDPGFEHDYLDMKAGNLSPEMQAKRQQEYENMNTDWMNILFDNGLNQRYNISVSGGNDHSACYLSLGYAKDKGPAILTNAERYTATLRLTNRITSSLSADLKLSASQNKGTYPYQINPYEYALNTSRSLPFSNNGQRMYYDASIFTTNWGIPNYQLDPSKLYMFNILTEMENSSRHTLMNNYNAIAHIDWNLRHNFHLQAVYGVNTSFSRNSSYAGEHTNYVAGQYRMGLLPADDYNKALTSYILLPKGGEYQEQATRHNSYTLRHIIEYSLLKGNHFIQAIAGNEARQSTYSNNNLFLLGYFPDSGKVAIHPPDKYDLYDQYFLKTGKKPTDHTRQIYRQLSWFNMLVYSFKNKYTLNLNTRQDGVNYFLKDSKHTFQYTWSAAVKWTLSEEPWLNKIPAINQLAIRSSYGFNSGLPEISNSRLTTTAAPPNNTNNDAALQINTFPNPGMEWEKTYTLNTGIDFSFFHSRLSGTIEAFRKKSKNLLANLDLAEENGVNYYLLNGASLYTQGYEAALQVVMISNKLWRWNAGTNLTYTKTRTSNSRFKDNGVIGNQDQYLKGNVISSGKDPNTMYAYQFNRLDENGAPTFKGIYDRDYPTQPTVAEYFANVFKPVGTRIPKIDGSIFTSISYKNWSLSTSFLLKLGFKQRLVPLTPNNFLPNAAENASADLLRHWKQKGDELKTNIPALAGNIGSLIIDPVTNQPYQYLVIDGANYFKEYAPLYLLSTQLYEMYNNSDLRVINASHIRLSTLCLQYTWCPQATKKYPFKKLNTFIQGNDLMVIANKKFHGQDPEMPAYTMPRRPAITLGAEVNF